ncbi:cytochrome c heme lyase [Parastagonospora nodorum]|nr:cytochrome c heme lyase [Parastagonospora nodorum]KAH5239985.1 cytochrome c heme lyase [Parastagonospora nodorum]KAH5295971.1 cytochrome c heme lyase [Parastagonospora nodorum]
MDFMLHVPSKAVNRHADQSDWSGFRSSNFLYSTTVTIRSPTSSTSTTSQPHNFTTMSSQDDPAAACPVDHKTREAWLAQARANGTPPANPHTSTPSPPPAPTQAQSSSAVQTSCDSSALDQSTSSPTPTSTSILSQLKLATDREVSTIPRALPSAASAPARPANNERDTAPDKKTGNWIYPSEQMFFDAMRRKSFDPEASDMRTIVPIHNAVNERAWYEIKKWEAGRSDTCGGPKLASFSGLSTSLTPRARWRSLMGYQTPFDRHDWVVDRCGEKIEYVIDFYAGGGSGAKKGEGLNFYLDVRPKLNSWEGWKMRVARYWGF